MTPTAAGIPLAGEWQVEFIAGGPVLPASARLRELRSWTELADPEVGRFAGTARYRLKLDAPATFSHAWLLDLGDVREAARVRLNGRLLKSVWAAPFTLRIHPHEPLRQRGNILEWDQPLSVRLTGEALDLQVNMEPRSILYSTLLLFGGTVLAAAAAFAIAIWLIARKGRPAEAARP